eukprot:2813690-Alexandrium_andersonii.AAC.1
MESKEPTGLPTGILTLRGTQRAIRTPPKARQRCNPPQSAIRHAEPAKPHLAFGAWAARAQSRP